MGYMDSRSAKSKIRAGASSIEQEARKLPSGARANVYGGLADLVDGMMEQSGHWSTVLIEYVKDMRRLSEFERRRASQEEAHRQMVARYR